MSEGAEAVSVCRSVALGPRSHRDRHSRVDAGPWGIMACLVPSPVYDAVLDPLKRHMNLLVALEARQRLSHEQTYVQAHLGRWRDVDLEKV